MVGTDRRQWRLVLLLLPVFVLIGQYFAESRRLRPPVEQEHALAIATADFDEDGVPDAIVSAGRGAHGELILHRGNVDSIFPNIAAALQRKETGEFSNTPFLNPVIAHSTPDRPEFLAAGDFNADGHQDVVIARRGAGAFYLLPGDGKGRFRQAQEFETPADITFLTSGDINRADGLADLLVAVSGRTCRLLIYEHPDGALKNPPELIDMPGPVRSIIIGQFDDQYPYDAVIDAGKELMLLSGRDLFPVAAEVLSEPARLMLQKEAAAASAIDMQLNDDAQPDSVFLNPGSVTPEVRLSAPSSTFTVTYTTYDYNDSYPGDGYCDIDSNPYNGLQCTLRAAIQEANATSTPDTVNFSIIWGGSTISLGSPLPAVNYPISIIASSAIELSGNYLSTNGITLQPSAAGSTVQGLTINRFSGWAIYLQGSGNIIRGNRIGTNVAGTAAAPNYGGIYINNTTGNIIGGTTSDGRNVISGNYYQGIYISGSSSTGNLVQGNYIGLDAAGTVAIGNGLDGIYINMGRNNTIGGTTAAARNIISGSSSSGSVYGVNLANGASGNLIQGNYIGTNAAGSSAVANKTAGIAVFSSGNTVGGAGGAGNLISGNTGDGIQISNSFSTMVRGNYIGTTAAGDVALQNAGYGISLQSSSGSTIGGSSSGNVIAFNANGGIIINSGDDNSIRQNSIHSNNATSGSGLGIDLSPAGVTSNDPGDTDGGANSLQNFPVLTAAYPSGTHTLVKGTLNSLPGSHALDFYSSNDCDPSGNGEGKSYLGNLNVTIGSGDTSFTADLPVPATQGSRITATATSASGNTSEFSSCIEVKPGITIDDVTKLEGDSGSAAAVFTVTLSAASEDDVTLDYATADETAAAGIDYTGVSGTLTISSGDLTGTIEVPVLGDVEDEIDETYVVNLGNAVGAHLIDTSGTGTIDDDDQPAVSISDVEVMEGNTGTMAAVFSIALSASSPQEIRVAYTTSDITAHGGTDYEVASGVVIFSPGSVLQPLSINVNGDSIDEPHETFAVDLSNPVDAVIADSRGIGTIRDDDPPLITISDVALYEGDSGTVEAVFTVSLTTGCEPPLTSVEYATEDGTAIDGEDYIATSGILTFGAGHSNGVIVVQIKGDTSMEPAEWFTVNLTNPMYGILMDAQAIGTIHDDETRIRQHTLNAGGRLSTSGTAEYALIGSIGQESVTGTSSEVQYVLQSGFWSYLGSGLVPVILSVARNPEHPDRVDLTWSGNNPPYRIYRAIDCSDVYSGLLSSEGLRAFTDNSPPQIGLVCYAILATSPGP